jgi:hypothetical protein
MKREYDLSKGKRGPIIPLPPEKVRITIRLDREIGDRFRDYLRKAHRGNHQTLINDALREHLCKPGPRGAGRRGGAFCPAQGIGENQSNRVNTAIVDRSTCSPFLR